MTLLNTVLMFFFYAFAGWTCESVLTTAREKHFVNRGFLVGPYCPIYGIGCVVITLLLSKYQGDLLALISMSMVLCSILEYLASWLMEVLFQARWWDYSEKRFNLNGRICLDNAFLFGIGGCVVIEIFNPYFFSLIAKIQTNALKIIAFMLVILFILDFIFSFKTIFNFRNEVNSITKDATEEIAAMVKAEVQEFRNQLMDEMELRAAKLRKYTKSRSEEIRQRLYQKNYLHRRLMQAYPHAELRSRNLKKLREEILEYVRHKK